MTLAQACPNCGAEVPPGFRYCGSCGHPMGEPVQAEAAEAAAMPSERRRVTVLFADLVGFSTLAEHMDPEDLRTLMTDTFAELTSEVEGREGVVEKFIGDAVMAIFGAPVAHEDDPERAVETALKMQEAVRRRSDTAPSPLSLRIGINSGLVVSGTVGDGTQAGVMGDAVNTAARLQQAADPGDTLVEASVWRRVRDRYETDHVGLLDVKGREQQVDAYRVLGTRHADARRRAPFVGRREELALLDLLWSSAQKGNTHVVSLIGDPGVGKSRLLSELPAREDALDIRITCGAERAFGPFLDLLERILGGMPEDVEDLKRRAEELGVDEETAILVSTLLGLGGAPPAVRMADEQKKRQVFAGVWQLLLGAASGRSAFIVLDDVHWADRSSLDLLGFLLERLGGVPLMLVLAYRPGFEQVERTALRASHTGIRLELLSAEESVSLARGFLGVGDLPSDLERLVASRAEGNPFFIEELLQVLLELGSLAVVDGTAVLARVEVEIPETVQGTILARVDRLGPKERELLHQGAVIGRSFSTDLIQTVVGDSDLRPALEELARAQLLVSQGPEQWAFKHALIQEVVYETLLLRQRRELHRRVAEALEAQAGDDPGFLEALAEHYGRADVPEKARAYAVRAGDLATQRMGFVEAKDRYETALRLWGDGDEEGRLALLHKLGWTRLMGGDLGGARTALVEAEAGWRALGDDRQAGRAMATLGRVYWIKGDGPRARETLARAIAILEPLGPSPELTRAYLWLSTTDMLLGRSDASMSAATRGIELAEAMGLDGDRSQFLNNIGVCLSFEGDPESLDKLRESLELAESSGDAEAIGRAYTNLPSCLGIFRRFREATVLSERGREVMRALGSPNFESFIAANEASSLAWLGRYEDAEALARESFASARATAAAPGLVNAGSTLVQVAARRGRLDDARTIADEVLPLARGLGGTEFLALMLNVEAELEHARGNMASARQSADEASELVMSVTALSHVVDLLPIAARLLPEERVVVLLDRVQPYVRDPSWEAVVAEAEGWVEKDPTRFARAAELNGSLELPYEEARCRLEAGELDRAEEIIKRFGLENGPLGTRLRELSST
jgi:class 3 adenylate cyclase/tetratricopeptide (TPR) repeat protein